MYKDYFGFRHSPFENSLDQRFFYLSASHKEVLAALLYFIREGKGFAFVCGDVGTGKTMVVNHFLDKLPPSVKPIVISNPEVPYSELVRYLARKVGIDEDGISTLELFDKLKEALEKADRKGRRVVLVIDEAHLLSDQSLEGVRLLSNLEAPQHKLLQILLVGQYELSHKLDRPQMRQLRQRININRFLSPMNITETIAYIDHRLEVAGAGFSLCFEGGCSKLLYRLTGGVPRSINSLCDHALLICQAKRLCKVNRGVLRQARDALGSDRILAPRVAGSRRHASWSFIRRLLPFGPYLILLILAGALVHGGLPGIGLQHPKPPLLKGPDRIDGVTIASVQQDRRLPDRSTIADPRSIDAGHAGPHAGMSQKGALHQSLHGILGKDADALSTDSLPLAARSQPGSVTPSRSGVTLKELAIAQNPASDKALEQEGRMIQPMRENPGDTSQSFANEPSAEKTADGVAENPFSTQASPAISSSGVDSAAVDSPLPGRKSVHKPRIKIVKKGDTLMDIALRWYPDDPQRGLGAILASNPSITDRNLIYPGQILTLPELHSAGTRSPVLQRGLNYYLYGSYATRADLQKALSRLSTRKINYLVVDTHNPHAEIVYQVFIGGYQRAEDLSNALQRIAPNVN